MCRSGGGGMDELVVEFEAEWHSQQVRACPGHISLHAAVVNGLPRRQTGSLSPTLPPGPQDVRLLIAVPRLPVAVSEVTPDPIEEAFRLLMRLRVSLKDAWVRAGVRVTLRPLLRRLPVVGALQVGCTLLAGLGLQA